MFNIKFNKMKKKVNFLIIALFAAGIISIQFTSCTATTEDITGGLDDLIENLDSTIVEIENDIVIDETIEADTTVIEDMEEVVEETVE